jgi:hypothetical protein
MFNFPRYLIFPERVYILSVLHQSEVGRAFEKDLIDYFVELRNPVDKTDVQSFLLGMAKNLVQGYRERPPLEWVLCRFLCDHVRSNSLHLLQGKDGEVLNFKNYKKYLGQATPDAETRQTLSYIFNSWIRVFPHENLSWRAIFVSAISIPEENLKRCINGFRLEDFIRETKKEEYTLIPKSRPPGLQESSP